MPRDLPWFNWDKEKDKEEVIIKVVNHPSTAIKKWYHWIESNKNPSTGKPQPLVKCTGGYDDSGGFTPCNFDHDDVGNAKPRFYWEVEIDKKPYMFTVTAGLMKTIEDKCEDIEAMGGEVVGTSFKILRDKNAPPQDIYKAKLMKAANSNSKKN